MELSHSQAFFEVYGCCEAAESNSFRTRCLCLRDFLKKLALLPFALIQKFVRTFFRAVGVVLGAVLVLITLGSSLGARDYFVSRISVLAQDLADWILLPIAVLTCFFRAILAFFLHPGIYFKY